MLLHDPDIRAAHEHVGGKGVPHRVRRRARGDTGALDSSTESSHRVVPRTCSVRIVGRWPGNL
jgi:hypothetical protein